MIDYVIDRRGLGFISGCSMTLPCKKVHNDKYAIHKINKQRVLEIGSGDIENRQEI